MLDSAIGVFCAKGGVEPQSETVWRQADKYRVPRMAFVNKMDISGADFFNVIDMIKNRLGKNPVAIQLPIGKEDSFVGVVDLFEMKAYIYNDDRGEDITITDIPEDMLDLADEYRGIMIEAICDTDDDLMEKYLEGEEPSMKELKLALRKATISTILFQCFAVLHIVIRVYKLLDAIIEYMPAPTDVADIKGVDSEGNEITRKSSDDEPFSALAFKIMADPLLVSLHSLEFIQEH